MGNNRPQIEILFTGWSGVKDFNKIYLHRDAKGLRIVSNISLWGINFMRERLPYCYNSMFTQAGVVFPIKTEFILHVKSIKNGTSNEANSTAI